jgi:hypothetical protein
MEEPMAWVSAKDPHLGESLPAHSRDPDISPGFRLVGSILRLVFVACLLAITVRVAMPQSETLWTIYDAPGDLVRMVLGLAVCVWVVFQLIMRPPKEARAYRTWVYFGLAAVPVALICLVAIW